MTNHYEEEDDDPAARLAAEYAAENEARYGGKRTADDGEQAPPGAAMSRVRIPTVSSQGSAKPAPADEQGSFDDQLADLINGSQEERSSSPGFTSTKRPSEVEAGGHRRPPASVGAEEVRLFPKPSACERRKGQHRPGLKRAPRFVLTQDDERVIEFLSRARYGTVSTVSFLLAKERSTVERRLRKLTERGYLAKRNGAAAGSLYYATEFGMEEIDSPIRVEQSEFSLRAVKHTLASANVLALLLGGAASKGLATELLMPAHSLWEHFVTEKELRRRISQQQGVLDPRRTPWKWDAPSLRARKMRLLSHWEAHEAAEGAREEADAPWTFLILPSPRAGRPGYHLPDLVLSYPRAKTTAEAQAVAIEVELHAVNREKLENAVSAYADEFSSSSSTYSKVVWLCRNEKVAREVVAVAKRLMPREFAPRFKIMLMDADALSGIAFTHRQAKFTSEQKAKRDANLVGERFTRGLYKHEREAFAAAHATGEEEAR